jgi:hypothetical protein
LSTSTPSSAWVGGIQAEDGVEVDKAAGLELGHLGIRQLHSPDPGGLSHVIATEAGAQVVDLDGSTHTMRSKAAIGAAPELIADVISLIHRSQTQTAL